MKPLMNYRFALGVLLIGLGLLLSSCGALNKDTVAVIEGKKISGDYFFFTQPPNFSERNRINQINTLEKFYHIQLRSHAARDMNLDEQDSLRYVIQKRQEEMLMEALYQMYVIDHIVTPKMMKQAYKHLDEKRTVRQILIAHDNSVRPNDSRTAEEAKQLAAEVHSRLINNDLNFRDAASTYSDGPRASGGGELGSYSWGQFPELEEFQQTIWEISPHTISKPIETRFGYHLIEVTSVDTLPLKSFQEEEERIKTMLIQNNREAVNDRASEALKTVMSEEGLQINDTTLFEMTNQIFQKYQEQQTDNGNPNLVEIAESINYKPVASLGGSDLTEEEFLEVIKSIHYTMPRQFKSPNGLMGAIRGHLQRQAFVNFAEEQNIRDYKNTSYRLQSISERTLDDYYVDNIVLRDFPPGDDSLKSFYERVKFEKYSETSDVHVREIYVSDLTLAEEILDKIEQSGNFVQLAEQYTERPSTQGNGGDLGWFKSDRYGPIGIEALSMDPGETRGPLQVGTGWSIIQLVEKTPGVVQDLDEIKSKVVRDYTNMYRPEILETNIETLEQKYDSRLNYDFLETI